MEKAIPAAKVEEAVTTAKVPDEETVSENKANPAEKAYPATEIKVPRDEFPAAITEAATTEAAITEAVITEVALTEAAITAAKAATEKLKTEEAVVDETIGADHGDKDNPMEEAETTPTDEEDPMEEAETAPTEVGAILPATQRP